MAKMYKTILEKVGGTPLVAISDKLNKGGARVLVKVEFFNPGGSVKDRIALDGRRCREARASEAGRDAG